MDDDATRYKFFDKMSSEMLVAMDRLVSELGAGYRSDWAVYCLMMIAGNILSTAPDDLKMQVMSEALKNFAEASGATLETHTIPQSSSVH